MTPNPILKVLSTFRKFGVKHLLIGGQACIVYGAAEFSRDSDFIILADPENLARVVKALGSLQAENIYVPSLEKELLDKGHGCHFRCRAPSVKGLRIDLLAKMRGCDDFNKLWKRKRTIALPGRQRIDVLGLEDLAQSKKTQRDKDWLMLARLIENDIASARRPGKRRITWWLRECRNANTLINLAARNRAATKGLQSERPLLAYALSGKKTVLAEALRKEEQRERILDKKYWDPLLKELESLRHKQARRRSRRTRFSTRSSVQPAKSVNPAISSPGEKEAIVWEE